MFYWSSSWCLSGISQELGCSDEPGLGLTGMDEIKGVNYRCVNDPDQVRSVVPNEEELCRISSPGERGQVA